MSEDGLMAQTQSQIQNRADCKAGPPMYVHPKVSLSKYGWLQPELDCNTASNKRNNKVGLQTVFKAHFQITVGMTQPLRNHVTPPPSIKAVSQNIQGQGHC